MGEHSYHFYITYKDNFENVFEISVPGEIIHFLFSSRVVNINYYELLMACNSNTLINRIAFHSYKFRRVEP